MHEFRRIVAHRFRCNLLLALLAEWPGSFACHCSNTVVERTPNKSRHTKLTLEKKILPPLLPGFELATFRSQVQHSTNKVSQLLCENYGCMDTHKVSHFEFRGDMWQRLKTIFCAGGWGSEEREEQVLWHHRACRVSWGIPGNDGLFPVEESGLSHVCHLQLLHLYRIQHAFHLLARQSQACRLESN